MKKNASKQNFMKIDTSYMVNARQKLVLKLAVRILCSFAKKKRQQEGNAQMSHKKLW